MPRSLEARMSAPATSRTWAMPPGAPSISGEATVCTESRISSDGFTASRWPSTAARSVSAARYRWSCRAPIRSARSRTWLADSSPVTYRVRCSSLADLAATSSSSVDLPTPGSPASSTTAPGTSPPPSTRSSSGTPVERAVACRPSTWPMGTAEVVTRPGVVVRTAGAPYSSIVPHAWHSGQRPSHLAVCQPHSVQR
ncbi:hypothetical protein SFUMM280S_10854 [Streptomyces fumanus]